MRRKSQRRSRAGALFACVAAALAGCPSRPPEPAPPVGMCCEGRGACLPASFVEERYVDLLGSEGCSAGAVCVPNQVRSLGVPPTCQASLTGSEGRCLPGCLPAVQERASQLRADGCGEGQLCVPCYDPITGASTKSCDLGDDPGPTQAAVTFPECCGELGQCAPQAALSEQQRKGLGPLECAADRLCVPKAALRAGASYAPSKCTLAALGAEGRCLPACLPQLAAGAQRLAQDGCEAGHVCAPCFDPLSGKATGACQQGADPGPTQPAVALSGCCEGLGHCVPPTLVPEEQRKQLGRDRCEAAGALCVPDAFADAAFQPRVCNVSAFGAEGRCVPSCLPSVAGQLRLLAQDGCDAHHVCAPCFDPVSGAATGACDQGTDPGPSRPPVLFGSCCEGRARCVPAAVVPGAQRAQLERGACAGTQELCVPSEIASMPSFVPASCMVSAFRAEGRCLSQCVPAVAQRAQQLREDGCGQGHACVPCYDPLNGTSTGACNFDNDVGPAQPPVTLGACCGGLGRCAPRSLVPAEQAAALGPDSCSGADVLCVAPAAAIEDPKFVPQTCEEPATHAEGRCLPACLPALAGRARFLSRGACAEGHLCAPCFDPISGASSGACTLAADPGPSKPAFVFASCCEAAGQPASGVCVPSALVPAGSPALPPQSCAGAQEVCVPKSLIAEPPQALPACTSLATSKGVCIQECYLDALGQTVSLAGSCAAGQRCVSCALAGAGIPGC